MSRIIRFFSIITLVVIAPLSLADNNVEGAGSSKLDESGSAASNITAPNTKAPNNNVANTGFPQWPERKVYLHTAPVPPPPPGPYMSTALSNVGSGFPGAGNTPAVAPVRPAIDPSAPWPVRQRPPQRWLPESGAYQFAPQDTPSYRAPGRFDGRGIMPMLQPRYQRPVQDQY